METQPISSLSLFDHNILTPIDLTERQLQEWLDLLDHLRDAHAPVDQLLYCRNQVARLQMELHRLKNKRH